MSPDPGGAVLRRWRARSQRLDAAARDAGGTVARVVHDAGGIQAQDMGAARQGVAVRTSGLDPATLDDALRDRRSVVRMWCMRGTLHLVPATLFPALLAVFGPVFARRGRRRLASLGLDDDAVARALRTVEATLDDRGALTRHEIASAVDAAGVDIDLDGQAPIHLVRRACLDGVACEAGERDGTPVYALRRAWVDGALPTRDDALAKLGRWYVDAFAPVSRADLTTWSGLPAADVARAWKALDGVVPVTTTAPADGSPDATDGLVAPAGATTPPSPGTLPVRLLPAFDSYLLAYDDRSGALEPRHRRQVQPGGGIVRPSVVVDGRVVGTWRVRARGRGAQLSVTTFDGLAGAAIDDLRSEAAVAGTAAGRELELTVVG